MWLLCHRCHRETLIILFLSIWDWLWWTGFQCKHSSAQLWMMINKLYPSILHINMSLVEKKLLNATEIMKRGSASALLKRVWLVVTQSQELNYRRWVKDMFELTHQSSQLIWRFLCLLGVVLFTWMLEAGLRWPAYVVVTVALVEGYGGPNCRRQQSGDE